MSTQGHALFYCFEKSAVSIWYDQNEASEANWTEL